MIDEDGLNTLDLGVRLLLHSAVLGEWKAWSVELCSTLRLTRRALDFNPTFLNTLLETCLYSHNSSDVQDHYTWQQFFMRAEQRLNGAC